MRDPQSSIFLCVPEICVMTSPLGQVLGFLNLILQQSTLMQNVQIREVIRYFSLALF